MLRIALGPPGRKRAGSSAPGGRRRAQPEAARWAAGRQRTQRQQQRQRQRGCTLHASRRTVASCSLPPSCSPSARLRSWNSCSNRCSCRATAAAAATPAGSHSSSGWKQQLLKHVLLKDNGSCSGSSAGGGWQQATAGAPVGGGSADYHQLMWEGATTTKAAVAESGSDHGSSGKEPDKTLPGARNSKTLLACRFDMRRCRSGATACADAAGEAAAGGRRSIPAAPDPCCRSPPGAHTG